MAGTCSRPSNGARGTRLRIASIAHPDPAVLTPYACLRVSPGVVRRRPGLTTGDAQGTAMLVGLLEESMATPQYAGVSEKMARPFIAGRAGLNRPWKRRRAVSKSPRTPREAGPDAQGEAGGSSSHAGHQETGTVLGWYQGALLHVKAPLSRTLKQPCRQNANPGGLPRPNATPTSSTTGG